MCGGVHIAVAAAGKGFNVVERLVRSLLPLRVLWSHCCGMAMGGGGVEVGSFDVRRNFGLTPETTGA